MLHNSYVIKNIWERKSGFWKEKPKKTNLNFLRVCNTLGLAVICDMQSTMMFMHLDQNIIYETIK